MGTGEISNHVEAPYAKVKRSNKPLAWHACKPHTALLCHCVEDCGYLHASCQQLMSQCADTCPRINISQEVKRCLTLTASSDKHAAKESDDKIIAFLKGRINKFVRAVL